MTELLKLASIDLGTNSTRLLIADCDGETTRTLDRRMAITRLGEGVDRTKRLSPEAVERTMAALRWFSEAMGRFRPAAVKAAATSVLRDCDNGEEFLDAAGGMIGCRPEILSGEEEARLSYLGAVSDLALGPVEDAGGVFAFDIGGGSTELMVGGREGDGLLVTSVDVGCVRMSERFLAGTDPPSRVAIGRMESHVTGELRPVLERILPARISRAVGLAGTVTTLSAMKQGLKEYDTEKIHHSRLTRLEVDDIYRRLASVPLEERKEVMGLEPGRADVIVGGAAVLLAVMELAGLEEIIVSEKDILDGLVLDLYRRIKSG